MSSTGVLMKILALIFFLLPGLYTTSTAQPNDFPTGLGVVIEGDYSLSTNTIDFSYTASDVHPAMDFFSGRFTTESRPDFSNPSFRYSQSTLYTHSHRRNADAFTNWRPVDDRNRTQVVIDGARGLFRVIRTSGN